MSDKIVSLSSSFKQGWEAFKANPGPAILGTLVYSLIVGVGQNIPVFGLLFVFLAAAPLAGGFALLQLNLVNRKNPQVSDIFQGFNKYGQFMGAYWLLMAVFVVSAIPALLCIPLGAFLGNTASTASTLIVSVGVLVSIVIYISLLFKWIFAMIIIADDWHEGSVITAFKKSNLLTEGRRGKLFWIFAVLSLFTFAGALALLVGVLITAPIAGCAIISIYNDLKASVSGQKSV